MREEVALSRLAYLPRAPRSSVLSYAHLILSSACYADYASPYRSPKHATFPSRVPDHCITPFCSEALVSLPNHYPPLFKPYESASRINPKVRGRINSVGRALDCRAGGRGFDPRRDPTNTQGLKITESLHCKRLHLRVVRMNTQNGGPVSSWRRKNNVPN